MEGGGTGKWPYWEGVEGNVVLLLIRQRILWKGCLQLLPYINVEDDGAYCQHPVAGMVPSPAIHVCPMCTIHKCFSVGPRAGYSCNKLATYKFPSDRWHGGRGWDVWSFSNTLRNHQLVQPAPAIVIYTLTHHMFEAGANSSADAQLGVPDLLLEGIRACQRVFPRQHQVLLQRVFHLDLVRAAVLVHQLTCACMRVCSARLHVHALFSLVNACITVRQLQLAVEAHPGARR